MPSWNKLRQNRDAKIIARLDSGESLRSVGRDFELTAEGVRQIKIRNKGEINMTQPAVPRAHLRDDGWPTRSDLRLMSPAEKAIFDATQVVEAAGASIALTDAVILLGKARDRVADHMEGAIAHVNINADLGKAFILKIIHHGMESNFITVAAYARMLADSSPDRSFAKRIEKVIADAAELGVWKDGLSEVLSMATTKYFNGADREVALENIADSVRDLISMNAAEYHLCEVCGHPCPCGKDGMGCELCVTCTD